MTCCDCKPLNWTDLLKQPWLQSSTVNSLKMVFKASCVWIIERVRGFTLSDRHAVSVFNHFLFLRPSRYSPLLKPVVLLICVRRDIKEPPTAPTSAASRKLNTFLLVLKLKLFQKKKNLVVSLSFIAAVLNGFMFSMTCL